MEQFADALAGRGPVAQLACLARGLGLASREAQMDHAGVGRAFDAEAALGEDLEHPVVVAQYVGLELADSGRARDASEMVEQHRADTAPLMLVEYRKGDFRTCRSGGDIAADTDEAFVAAGAQRRPSATWLTKSISVKRTRSCSVSECFSPKKRW